MRAAQLYVNFGDGWENITAHDRPHAALDSLQIDWGSESATEQPDVNVLTFRIIDRDGTLAGRSTSLAGCRVMVQISPIPTWGDAHTSALAWQAVEGTWATLADSIDPDPSEPPSDRARTLFTGRVTTGGEITKDGDRWVISLTAASDLIQAKRDQKQGPASGEWHWVGTTSARVSEIQNRLKADGAPTLSKTAFDILAAAPPAAWYDLDSFPSLTDLLQRLARSLETMPLLMEQPATHEIGLAPTNAPAALTLHSDGHLSVKAGTLDTQAIQGSEIIIDSHTLTLPDPSSDIVLKGKKATWKDGKLGFEEAEQDFNSQGFLPENLTNSQSSISLETDAVLADESSGHFTPGKWAPQDKASRAQWLEANTMRLRPSEMTVSSAKTDLDAHEDVFTPAAFPLGFVHNRFTRLVSDDGHPATGGVWLATGGTLTFTHHPRPEFRNVLTLHPLPMDTTQLADWGDLEAIGMPWADLDMTWGEFGTITSFQP